MQFDIQRWPVWVAGSVSALAYWYLAMQSTEYGVATLSQLLLVCAVGVLAVLTVFYLAGRNMARLTFMDVL
ncbi:MAG: hypothetical protein AAF993_20160, partial [Pseudomonadota bacterium]